MIGRTLSFRFTVSFSPPEGPGMCRRKALRGTNPTALYYQQRATLVHCMT